jgi:hypothetical protein
MIDGSDKLLMEHRNRQVDAAAKRITELEAEIAALKTGGKLDDIVKRMGISADPRVLAFSTELDEVIAQFRGNKLLYDLFI